MKMERVLESACTGVIGRVRANVGSRMKLSSVCLIFNCLALAFEAMFRMVICQYRNRC